MEDEAVELIYLLATDRLSIWLQDGVSVTPEVQIRRQSRRLRRSLSKSVTSGNAGGALHVLGHNNSSRFGRRVASYKKLGRTMRASILRIYMRSQRSTHERHISAVVRR